MLFDKTSRLKQATSLLTASTNSTRSQRLHPQAAYTHIAITLNFLIQPQRATIHLSPYPLPNYSSQDSFEPCSPHLTMERWTNQALPSMLQAWQDVIDSGAEQSTLSHPLFQEVTKELIEREIMSVSWRWTVDIDEVDMAMTRAMVEHLAER